MVIIDALESKRIIWNWLSMTILPFPNNVILSGNYLPYNGVTHALDFDL